MNMNTNENTPQRSHQMTYVLCLLIIGLVVLTAANSPTMRSQLSQTFAPILSQSLPPIGASAAGIGNGSPTSLVGQPTISVDFIEQVLAAYHSPAAGTGVALYILGKEYNIDPVWALAFFMHESTFGTQGMARVTYSLGNLRCINGFACNNGYASFPSWQEGYHAWYHLIGMLYMATWHRYTPEQIIPVYAPSSDNNNVSAYIASLEHAVATWRSGTVLVS